MSTADVRPDGAAPEISVVIPTHDRRESLLATLDALARQTLAPGRFEVVVALDSVSDGSADAVAARVWPFALLTVAVAARNAAATRNAGAARARARRLVFLDDDVAVGPGFLQAHLDAGGGDGDACRVVIGRSIPDIRGQGWFHEGLAAWWNGRFAAMADPGHRFADTDVMSGNLSVPRALFDRIGGFDAQLPCREDYEFGTRALAAGASLAYAHEASGLHHDESTPERNLRRVRAEGIADVAIARRHPSLFPALTASKLTWRTASSRVLRLVCFRMPGLVAPLIVLLGMPLGLLERLRLRAPWRLLSYWRWGFAYYSGVAAASGSGADLFAFWERAKTGATPRQLVLDIADGIEAARAAVEAARPDECLIRVGTRTVGHLPAWPGLEPLGRRHLDSWLGRNLWAWAPAVAAAERLAPLPRDPGPTVPCAGWSVGEVDLADWTLRAVRQPLSLPLAVLVRWRESCLGWIWVEPPLAEGDLLGAIRRAALGKREVCEALLRAQVALPEAHRTPPISVVVCTRDRAESLAECLEALAALDYPDYEVVVVDNASQTDATARLVASRPGVRYFREDRPGLDWSRNRGIQAARHDVIAFTDDDTRADRHWLGALARAFDDAGVSAVTGLVAPISLASDAERYFEFTYGGMGKGLRPRNWSLAADGPRGILWASGCGVGANMAFRRAAFALAGPFDPALDVGTATRGGGDVEMFHRLLARGGELRYAPDAMVWHRHRGDWDGLARQLADNGSGFAAYLLAAWRGRTVPRHVILRFALRDWIWGWLGRRLLRPGAHRRDLVLREWLGLLRGPARARRAGAEAAALARAPDSLAPPLAQSPETS